MKSYEGYLYELGTIDTELKRINDHAKNLRLQRTRVLGALYRYMCANNLDKVSNGRKDITLKQCTPREKKSGGTKPKKQKKQDAIELFRDAGIPNPERFYEEFEGTQKKNNTNTNESSSTNPSYTDDIFGAPSKKKKGGGGYDSQLGF